MAPDPWNGLRAERLPQWSVPGAENPKAEAGRISTETLVRAIREHGPAARLCRRRSLDWMYLPLDAPLEPVRLDEVDVLELALERLEELEAREERHWRELRGLAEHVSMLPLRAPGARLWDAQSLVGQFVADRERERIELAELERW